jgi:hypothetical protein
MVLVASTPPWLTVSPNFITSSLFYVTHQVLLGTNVLDPTSKLYAEIQGRPEEVPFVRRAEHLIHLELADVACHHPIIGSCALVGGEPVPAVTCLIVDLLQPPKGRPLAKHAKGALSGVLCYCESVGFLL